MNYENKETLLTTIEQQKAQGINYQFKSTEVKKTKTKEQSMSSSI